MESLLKRFLANKEAKNAGWIISGRLFQLVLSLFVSILTARFLGPSNYGLINYAASYVAFFTSLCTLGINSILVHNLIQKPSEQGKTIGTAIVLRIISSFFSALLIILIVFFVDKGEKETLLIVSMYSLSLVFQVFDLINYWFQARYQSSVTSIILLVAYISTSIYRLILLYLNAKAFWFALAASVDHLIVAILLLIAYRKNQGQRLSFSVDKAKELLGSSYHYIFAGMMVSIYSQTDKFMLKQMLNEAEVGFYSAASAICSMWVFILTAIIDSMYPTIVRLYQTDYSGFEKKNRQLYFLVFYISCFVSIVFLLFGEGIINILYGTSYSFATKPLKIVTWYTAFAYIGVARNAWIVSEKKQKYLKYIYGIAALINVLLNYFMIPILGASGAAFASLLTQICTSIILPFIIKDLRKNSRLILDAILLRKVF